MRRMLNVPDRRVKKGDKEKKKVKRICSLKNKRIRDREKLGCGN